MKNQLGRVISGSLSEGLLVRLDCNIDLETIKTGKFVSVVGKSYRFFSLITDLKLEIRTRQKYPIDSRFYLGIVLCASITV